MSSLVRAQRQIRTVAGQIGAYMDELSLLRGNYDFFDFGCSDGATIKFVKSHWPTMRECGIDICERKINLARNAGLTALVHDILTLPRTKIVRFVTLSHFLEHVDSVTVAREMITKAIDVADGFVLVKQPWFDSDAPLMESGLKFFWSDWTGHRNPMSALSFYRILRDELADGRIRGFTIFGRAAVLSSADRSVIPLSAPEDQHHYDPDRHGTKDHGVRLPPHTYREVVAVAEVGSDPLAEELLMRLGDLTPLASGGVSMWRIAGRQPEPL